MTEFAVVIAVIFFVLMFFIWQRNIL